MSSIKKLDNEVQLELDFLLIWRKHQIVGNYITTKYNEFERHL